MACSLALASPLVKSTMPALAAAMMVIVNLVFFSRKHSWHLGCMALFTLALAKFGILLTVHPAILSTYFG
jgi:ABC-type polysaccharide/polyol phosphate export permease